MTPGEAAAFLVHVKAQIGPRIVRATVPLLAVQDGEVKVVGTATLLRVAGTGLLVMASHVAKLQAKHGFELSIPVADGRGVTLGGTIAWAVDDDRYDVAAVRASPELEAALVEGGHDFLSLADVEDVELTSLPEGGFVLVGFPHEGRRVEAGAVTPVPHYLGSVRYRGKTDDLPSSYREDTHFLLSLGRVRDHATGSETSFPHPGGMSGCSVWCAYENGRVVGWRPEFARWIGVQSAYYDDPGRLKVVPWSFVRAFLVQQFPDLAPALRLALPQRLGVPRD